MVRVMVDAELFSRGYPVRRLRFIRRQKPSAVSEREMALCVQITELQNENTRLKKLYSESRAGLRQATGCETPSPRAQTLAAQQMAMLELPERRHGMTPSARTAMRLEVEDIRSNAMLIAETEEGMRLLRRQITWNVIKILGWVLLAVAMLTGLFFFDSRAIYEWFANG